MYTRETADELLLVVCNFTGNPEPYSLPDAFQRAELLLSNYTTHTDILQPYEARLYRKEEYHAI